MIQLQYDIRPAEHLEMVRLARTNLTKRFILIGVGVLGVLMSTLLYLLFHHDSTLVLIGLFAAIVVVEAFLPILIHRRIYYRNPRLFGTRTVTFDDEGIKSDSDIAHIEVQWSKFEKFKETPNLFLFFQTKDVVGLTPKRAFLDAQTLAQFRNLVACKVPRAQ